MIEAKSPYRTLWSDVVSFTVAWCWPAAIFTSTCEGNVDVKKKKRKFCGTNTWKASHLICWRGLSKPHKKGILLVSVTLPEQSNRKSVWCQFCHFPSHCVDWESSPSCPIVVFHGRFTLLVISPLPPGTFGSLACPHPPTCPVHLIRLARPHKVFFLAWNGALESLTRHD